MPKYGARDDEHMKAAAVPAAPRRPRHHYRCSLPGLTGFAVLRREGTGTATIEPTIVKCSGLSRYMQRCSHGNFSTRRAWDHSAESESMRLPIRFCAPPRQPMSARRCYHLPSGAVTKRVLKEVSLLICIGVMLGAYPSGKSPEDIADGAKRVETAGLQTIRIAHIPALKKMN